MLARLGKGDDAWALIQPDVTAMISRGRAMQGWVRAGPAAYGDDELRRRLIDAAVEFARALPPRRNLPSRKLRFIGFAPFAYAGPFRRVSPERA